MQNSEEEEEEEKHKMKLWLVWMAGFTKYDGDKILVCVSNKIGKAFELLNKCF